MQTAETAMHIIICKWYKYPEDKGLQFRTCIRHFSASSFKTKCCQENKIPGARTEVFCPIQRRYICTYFSFAYEKSILNRCVFNLVAATSVFFCIFLLISSSLFQTAVEGHSIAFLFIMLYLCIFSPPFPLSLFFKIFLSFYLFSYFLKVKGAQVRAYSDHTGRDVYFPSLSSDASALQSESCLVKQFVQHNRPATQLHVRIT